jgi:predicted transcriptional regulator
MPKPKAKTRDHSKENRTTIAVCLQKATASELKDHAVKAERSISWVANKAIAEYLQKCATV